MPLKQPPDDVVPLRPVEFYVLLALAEHDRHGYGIILETERLSDGALRLDPGTLYRALRRMLKAGWIVESARRPAAHLDDERRRYYRVTPLGRRLASSEAERLMRLVKAARLTRRLKRA